MVFMHTVDRACNFESDSHAMTLWTAVVQLVLVLPFLGLVEWIPPLVALGLLALASVSAFARVRWYTALSHSEGAPSRLMPIARLGSLVVLAAAVFLLGEDLPGPAAVGAVAMIFGAIAITLEAPVRDLRTYVAENLIIWLVVLFAISRGLNSVGYKLMLTHTGVGFFSLFFFLKVFECLAVVAIVYSDSSLRTQASSLANPQAFVGARSLQTISGLLYLFVLHDVDLSKVEAIAAIGPLIALAWEWFDRKTKVVARFGGPVPRERPPDDRVGYRVAGILLVLIGFVLLQWNKP